MNEARNSNLEDRNSALSPQHSVLDQSDAGIEWVEQAPLENLNSMGLRATARLLATVTSEKGLTGFLKWAKKQGEEFYVLGAGTNVVFAEEFFDRPILRLGGEFARFDVGHEKITAGAAVPLARLVEEARKARLSGLEGAWGIPGWVGGALVGNAGTADWAIGDQVDTVEVFDRSGVKEHLAVSEIGFRYRRSRLAEWVVTRTKLALKREKREVIEERIERARARRSGQPHGARSAGCIFKNPPGDAAGRLIEAAGLKGLRRGGAVVSTEHANFILNEGNATGADVIELIDEIRRRVYEQFKVELETEVQILRSSKP
jgi:UDP-N-acetylmuramate dehydrogenase